MLQLNKRILIVFVIISLAFTSPVATADGSGSNTKVTFDDSFNEQNPEEQFQTGTKDISVFGLLIQVILALFFVGALIFLLVKFLSLRNRFTPFNQPIKLIGTMAFTPQKSIRVVELGNSLYFLGVGDDISLLQKIDDPEEIDLIKATLERGSSMNFSHILKSKMSDIMTKRQNIDQYFENREDLDRNEGKRQ